MSVSSLQLNAGPSGCSPGSRPEEPTVRSGEGGHVTGQAAAGRLSLSLLRLGKQTELTM